ncbi:MAG: hypothetical protein HOM25_10310 [Rhodospirillaceae bacterium]|nr:hypothetical protein [Rhodospirillaceae bacterium]MBT5667602.1 hypothetical protein [Rhodospirillaceae bacterium]MBT5811131.1 hypothetical protein [Rhodospirillaceae bacterium]
MKFEADDDLATLNHAFTGDALNDTLGYNLVGERLSEMVSDPQHILTWLPLAPPTGTPRTRSTL